MYTGGDMMIRIGINGFGRIGRNFLKTLKDDQQYEVVAINDLTDATMLAHLYKYDSMHGICNDDVVVVDNELNINGKRIAVYSERNPLEIPWKKNKVDIVIEATGHYRDGKKAMMHIEAGAKKVIISAPAKNEDITIVMGVNEHKYNHQLHHIISNASCTTNCLAPIVKVINKHFGLERGLMTTIHSYTNDQSILDLPHTDYRRARAAGVSIIPTTTGAAKAVELVLPELRGKLNGMAMRVPTPNVSVVDLVMDVKLPTTVEEVNRILEHECKRNYSGIMGYSDQPLVSKDYNGNKLSSIIDGLSTLVIDRNMIKIVSWYDNEWGYSNRLVDLAYHIGENMIQDIEFQKVI
jgi:glyceraldehyde 3-phosphate dehydrogenase